MEERSTYSQFGSHILPVVTFVFQTERAQFLVLLLLPPPKQAQPQEHEPLARRAGSFPSVENEAYLGPLAPVHTRVLIAKPLHSTVHPTTMR